MNRSRRWVVGLVGLVGLMVTGFGRRADTQESSEGAGAQETPRTVVEVLRAEGRFGQLLSQLERKGLLETLEGEGPWTVFAPSDLAFGELPPGSIRSAEQRPGGDDQVLRILKNHVAKGAWRADRLAEGTDLESLAGRRLEIRPVDEGLAVNGVSLLRQDLVAGNGVVHETRFLVVPLATTAPSTETGTLTFPAVSGGNLEGRSFDLPGGFERPYNLVLVAFEQWQQRSVNTWMPLGKELEERYANFRFYELPTIEDLPATTRVFINLGMAAGIPSRDTRERTITLYTGLPAFQRALAIPGRDHIQAFLVTPEGQVLWRAAGPVHEEAARQARAFLAEHGVARDG